MRTMYAEALPRVAGGPNEGAGGFADGRDTSSSLETHKQDLIVPTGYMSRLELLRGLAANRAVRIVAALTFAAVGAGCAGQGGEHAGQPPTATAEANGRGGSDDLPEGNRPCYDAFETLAPSQQEECRSLIAGMDTEDINKLDGLDEARWANYYRHVALGEKTILRNVVRTGIMEEPGGADSAALHFLTGYQADIYRLAWFMQNKKDLAEDPRTVRALLGTDSKDSEGYKLAAYLAENTPSDGQDAETYAINGSKNASLFESILPENVNAVKEGENWKLSLTAAIKTTTGTPRRQVWTVSYFPYMEAHQTPEGMQEKPDDPNAPEAEIFAKLGTPLLAGPVQFRDASA